MSTAEELAFRFNLSPVRGRREWRGDCPACGYGAGLVLTHREGRALLWCASCQDKEAMTVLLREAGGLPAGIPQRLAQAAPRRDDAQAMQEVARRLWDSARPADGTLAARYLSRRGLPDLAASPALRFLPECRHKNSGLRLPAMVAAVRKADGSLSAIHRTYLQADGQKAAVDPPKATLGPMWGGAIRLDALAPELVIGEGIESSASAGALLGLPAWAAYSAGNLSALVLPAEVRAVVIAADHDKNGEGQRAAERAAMRWRAEGRHVRIAMPDLPGIDFNDIHREAANG